MNADRTILLLEDDLIDEMTIKRALDHLQILNKLIVKENGLEGLTYLKGCDDLPGLIFLDINMPKMDGIEFLGHIKKDERLRSIPVVVLTTSKNQGDKLSTFNFGIAGYMVKPVSYSKFKTMISTIKSYWDLSEYPY